MLIGGGSGTSEAKAQEAARKAAQEAARRAAEEARRKAEEAARKAAAESAAKKAAELAKTFVDAVKSGQDADATGKATTARGTSALKLDATLKTPEKLAEAAVEDPAVVVEAAAKDPAKFTDTLLKGAGLVAGGFVGSEAFQITTNSLSVQKKVNEIKDLTTKITEAKAEAGNLVGATGTALRQAADDAQQVKGVDALNRLGKLSAGLSVATGVNSALNLRNSVAALRDGATAKEVATVAGDALGALRGADEAVKLAKGVNVGFLAGKANPLISIAASGADSIKRVDTLIHDWDKLSNKERVANFAALGGNLTDIVGSGLIASGVGAPIGVALKGVGAGLSLVSLGIQNYDSIKSAASKATHFVSDKADDVAGAVANGAKKVASALNPFD